MRKNYIFIVLPFLWLFDTAKAQESDFRTWWGVELNAELFNLVDIQVNPELRLWDNSSRFETVVTQFEASVPVTKYLRFGAFYRLETESKIQDYVHYGNRFGEFGEAEYKIHRLKIAYRAICQQEYKDWHTSDQGYIPTIEHRHKVSFKYNIKGSKMDPFLAGEMFFTLMPEWQRNREKLRITGGVQYKISKHTDISLAYKYQKEFFENNPMTSSIVNITLSHDL